MIKEPHTKIGLSPIQRASSVTASANFFERVRLFGGGGLRVLGPRALQRPAERLQRLPASLGQNTLQPEVGAITSPTFRLDHSPPSGGGSASRSRTVSSTSGVSRLGLRPLRRRPLAKAPGPDAL